MKVKYEGTHVTLKMTIKQLDSLRAVFETFTDQVNRTNEAYGDCVLNIERLNRAIKKANDDQNS